MKNAALFLWHRLGEGSTWAGLAAAAAAAGYSDISFACAAMAVLLQDGAAPTG